MPTYPTVIILEVRDPGWIYNRKLPTGFGWFHPNLSIANALQKSYLPATTQVLIQSAMSLTENVFLPGVPKERILKSLAASPGNEIASGKLLSPVSSAALAVNSIGWFIERTDLFPAFPGMESLSPAESVDVEYQARFPWRGGHHPWLDGAVTTKTHLIGIESKRYEPFRDSKKPSFSDAYDRPVWEGIEPYAVLKDSLRTGDLKYEHLDAAQLVKHALGLCTDAKRKGLKPGLVYLYAEPTDIVESEHGRQDIARHRSEIADFAKRVASAQISFIGVSYHSWISSWTSSNPELHAHAQQLRSVFKL